MAGLRAQTEDIALIGTHAESFRSQLLAALDQAAREIERERAAKAIRALRLFKLEALGLVRSHHLGQTDAESLLSGADDAIGCEQNLTDASPAN